MFTICSQCGYPENKHNYRHQFDGKITVVKNQDEKGDLFLVNASDFQIKKKEEKCSFPQCRLGKIHHQENGGFLKHNFIPIVSSKLNYNIKLAVPMDSKCRKCPVNLLEHKNNNEYLFSHKFYTKIVINKYDTDDTVELYGENEYDIVDAEIVE